MESDENDPQVLLLKCPNCKIQCSSTADLYNHMSFPGNPCLAILGVTMVQFKRKFNSRQVMARRCTEVFNRQQREKVSEIFHLYLQSQLIFAIGQIKIGDLL